MTGLHYARLSRGMSQPDLARRSGTTKQQVGRLEKVGGVELTRSWADRFAPHLGYSSEQILYWDIYVDEKGRPLDPKSSLRARMLRLIHGAGPKLSTRLRTNAAVKSFLAGLDKTDGADAVTAIAEIAGDEMAAQLSEFRPPGGDPTYSIASLPVIAVAEAGAFRAMVAIGDQEQDLPKISAPRSGRFPNAKHFALEVRGDSMNASNPPITDGTYVLCVDVIDAELSVETGQIYVVRRTLDGGQTYEWTVKRAKVFRDRIELHPESTNAIHKPTVIPRAHDTEMTNEVIAVGWVYGVFNSLESSRR
jgi:SOS-response transcriptional repressor LexA